MRCPVFYGLQDLGDKLFQFLLDYKKKYPDLYFMPRQKVSDRLDNGYWFVGDENYLGIGFYTGGDTSTQSALFCRIRIPIS